MGKKEDDITATERKEFLWREDKNHFHILRAREMRKKYGKEISKLEE